MTDDIDIDENDFHKPQVRGHWIPIEIWEMAENDTITFAELRLLLLIDSYVRSKGIGCWASNHHLGEKIKRTQVPVSLMITKLKGLNLLVEKGTVTIRNLKYRLLETAWSRIFSTPGTKEEQEKHLEQCIHKELKHKISVKVKLNDKVDSLTTPEKAEPGSLIESNKASHSANNNGTIIDHNKQNTRQQEYGRNNVRTAASQARGSTSGVTHTNGKHNNQDNFAYELACYTHDELLRVGKLIDKGTTYIPKWSSRANKAIKEVMIRLDVTHDEAKKHLKMIVDDHITSIQDQYQPQLYSLITMLDGIVRLENARSRRLNNRLKTTKQGDPNRLSDDEIW